MKPQTFGPIIPNWQLQNNIGFIYLITVNNLKYIGKKEFSAGTNWETYQSSSKEIKDLLKIYPGKFEILDYAETKRELTYLETMYQFKYDVLRDPDFANKNILGKFYRGKLN